MVALNSRIREGVVESYLLSSCRRYGFLCMKFVSPMRDGVPDRVVVTPGGTVFVEVKRPDEDLNPLQKATHPKMRRFGARIYVVDDRDSVNVLMTELERTSRPISTTFPATQGA